MLPGALDHASILCIITEYGISSFKISFFKVNSNNLNIQNYKIKAHTLCTCFLDDPVIKLPQHTNRVHMNNLNF